MSNSRFTLQIISADPKRGIRKAKVVKGTVIFGGLGAGAIALDVKLDTGETWGFAGGMVPAFGLAMSLPLTAGDFPGYDYMAGGCMAELAAASVGMAPGGGCIINFHGLREIGWVTFATAGVDIAAAVGGGKWFIDAPL